MNGLRAPASTAAVLPAFGGVTPVLRGYTGRALDPVSRCAVGVGRDTKSPLQRPRALNGGARFQFESYLSRSGRSRCLQSLKEIRVVDEELVETAYTPMRLLTTLHWCAPSTESQAILAALCPTRRRCNRVAANRRSHFTQDSSAVPNTSLTYVSEPQLGFSSLISRK